MSKSKKFYINEKYKNPFTNTPIIINSERLMTKYGLKNGDVIPKDIEKEAVFFTTGDVIINISDKIPLGKNMKIFGEILFDIKKSNDSKLDYIEISKNECTILDEIFQNAQVSDPNLQPHIWFLQAIIKNFIKDFDTPEEETKTEPEITQK